MSPSEASGNVTIASTYDIEDYNPAADVYWDSDNFSKFKCNLQGTANTSYGTLLLHGDRKRREWRETLNSKMAVLGNRGVEGSDYSPQTYLQSKTLQIHGGRKDWLGAICFNDNHIETLKTFFPDALTPIGGSSSGGDPVDDGLFSEEDTNDGPGMGSDVFLCMIDDGNGTEGQDLQWESAISWD